MSEQGVHVSEAELLVELYYSIHLSTMANPICRSHKRQEALVVISLQHAEIGQQASGISLRHFIIWNLQTISKLLARASCSITHLSGNPVFCKELIFGFLQPKC